MPVMERMGPEPETVARAAAGDGAAFREIVDAWRGRVLAFGYRMTGDGARAEDLAQEVFLHLYTVLRRYDPSRPFAPWMRRVMTNVVLNRLRRRSPAEASLGDGGDAGPIPPDPRSPDPVREAETAETAAAVREGLAALPPGWRAVVALRYSEGLSIAEVAAALDLPENTVKTRLFRAREALRGPLRSLGEGAARGKGKP
jgi:RNA polymerase sigma-70 factor, ECF subfamily